LQFHLRSGRAGAVDLIESINECNAVAVKAHKGAGVMPKPRRNRR
jgi:hypothetical protein